MVGVTSTFLRRSPRRRRANVLLLLVCFCNILEVLQIHWNLRSSTDNSRTYPEQPAQRIYLASTHWNNEALLRSHWNDAVIALVKHFGAKNIYVSIYESGSWDGTKDALRSLAKKLEDLGVPKTFILDGTTHTDEIAKIPTGTGWIDTPRGKKEFRRIPYLAGLRNLSLRPLSELAAKGLKFDKILFLNDVVFTVGKAYHSNQPSDSICLFCIQTKDVLNLLDTNHGFYAAACALDFAEPPSFYDTFALRDSNGEQPLMQTWP